ncbi:MAG: hypothetical protein MRY63_04510 [Neomegalonema sp.]|nr:hypothetical protein [Neomegalonema sp.]
MRRPFSGIFDIFRQRRAHLHRAVERVDKGSFEGEAERGPYRKADRGDDQMDWRGQAEPEGESTMTGRDYREDPHARYKFTKRDLEKMIREQIANDNIRDAIYSRTIVRRMLGGAVIAFFGLALSLGLSAFITDQIAQTQYDNTQKLESLAAIGEFSALVSDQVSLITATRETLSDGGSRSAILERWRSYRQGYQKWKRDFEKNNLKFRHFFGFAYESFIETAIRQSIDQYFEVYDRCLSQEVARKVGDKGVVLTQEGNLVVNALSDAPVSGDNPSQYDSEFYRCIRQNTRVQLGTEKTPLRLVRDVESCRDEFVGIVSQFVLREMDCRYQNIWNKKTSKEGEPDRFLTDVYYEALLKQCGIQEYEPLSHIDPKVYARFCSPLKNNLFDRIVSRFVTSK